MDDDAVADLEGCAEVFVGAPERRAEVACFGNAEGCEDKNDAEGAQAHSAHGGNDVFAVGVKLAGPDVGEVSVEAAALFGGHFDSDGLQRL